MKNIASNQLMILDDETDVADGLASILSSEGYSVVVSSEAAAVETLLDFDPPAVLLSDIRTEGRFAVQGLDILRDISKRGGPTKVILMTGLSIPGIREEALSYGALGFLEKPFEADDLLRLLDESDGVGRNETGGVVRLPSLGDITARSWVAPRFLPTYRRHGSSWRLTGYEGLVQGPASTPFQNPLALFRLAEKSGRLALLDRVCARKVLEAARALDPSLDLAINLHPITLETPGTADEILAALGEFGRDPRTLVVEIVERGAVAISPALVENLERLRRARVKFALDDVGEGNANLVSLGIIRPEILKISQYFTQGVARDRMKLEIIRTILDLASRLGIETIVEGVEFADDYAVVRDLGVRSVQGFWFCEPRTLDRIDDVPAVVPV